MELTLTRQTGTRVAVTCDGLPSHTFDLQTLIPNGKDRLPLPLDDPVAYGKVIYDTVFPPETAARRALEQMPERLLLVATDSDLDAVPWEYAYGPDGFLVLECQFVRGLPLEQRIDPSGLGSSLHIIAVPSNPLSHELEPLNIDGEWTRLKEIIQELPYAITFERTRPPTLERLRQLVANQRHCIVHFMGHGEQHQTGAILCLEKDNGALDSVTAKQFILRVRGTVFLVTLNACVSAAPGPTPFSNLAAALARQKTPYVLGMRFSIPDEDARTFSRSFYSDLARGSSVEEALRQARLALAGSPRLWVVGVPVLYTALKTAATGFVPIEGTPIINEHQPHIEASALPRTEGTFQGRSEELKLLGEHLTGDSRPPLLTIHGGGGQGKTALTREAVERFAYAWPGGVWAISLENLPSRELFISNLARFLSIDTQKVLDPDKTEHLVIAQLALHRTLIVLDNAETLVEAVEANDQNAVRLAQFIRERLPRPPVCLLATSRSFLGWSGEIGLELGGLAPMEGARLFQQNVPRWAGRIDLALAWELSEKVGGHPLSLRLLSGAFNACTLSFLEFVKDCETQVMMAENKYAEIDHRHRTLYACIETSVRYLSDQLRTLLVGLSVFHSPFLPQTVVAIFDSQVSEFGEAGEAHPLIYSQLHELWKRGILALEKGSVHDGDVFLYHLLPVVCSYVERYIEPTSERESLLARFGTVYAQLAYVINESLEHSAAMIYVAQRMLEDLERGIAYVQGVTQGYYLRHWGWILQRLGDPQHALAEVERALEIAQGRDRQLELRSLHTMALIYHETGQSHLALELYERTLPIRRELKDRPGEATTLSNMAEVFRVTGQLQRALKLLNQALPITREVGDQEGEATVLSNMSLVYHALGQTQQALELGEQALSLQRQAGNRIGEATILHNMALVYQETGQPRQALELYEQALLIRREMRNRADEAITLTNLAGVYLEMGQVQQALDTYERALSIQQEIGDRRSEATTVTNMAGVYRVRGQLQQALELLEQALPIRREVGDREGEASTLNSLAGVYRARGQLQQALELLEQALLILREVGSRRGEASTLTSIAGMHLMTKQPRQALELLDRALSIVREVGDRGAEAVVLNGMAEVYHISDQPQRTLELLNQSLLIAREMGDRVGEATVLNNMARVYQEMGQPQQALAFCKQAFSIQSEVAGRANAATMRTMAELYHAMALPRQALEFYEQALSLIREEGNHRSEATILHTMAAVYREMEQPQQALVLYEQALAIWREVGDQANEAVTLHNMALANQAIKEQQQSLAPYEQALARQREAGDRAGEAAALVALAGEYQDAGHLQQALALYEQALPIMREVRDRAGESATLNNLGLVYQGLEKPHQALELYKQALPMVQEMGSRPGEATTLHNMALAYHEMGQPEPALGLYGQALSIWREEGDQAHEASTLCEMAVVSYQHRNRPEEAIAYMEKAITLLVEVGLSEDSSGRTIDFLQRLVAAMRNNVPQNAQTDSSLDRHVEQIISNTIAVMTVAQDRRAEWREVTDNALHDAQQAGAEWQIEADLLTVVLAILDGQTLVLSKDHPYAEALAAIQDGIAAGGPQFPSDSDAVRQAVLDFINAENWDVTQSVIEAQQALLFRPEVEILLEQNITRVKVAGEETVAKILEQHLTVLRDCKKIGVAQAFEHLKAAQEETLPFDAELIPMSIAALMGGPQEKMMLMQYLTTMVNETMNENLKALVATIQLALFSSDLSQLGRDLNGMYRQAWEAIIAGVETGGVDPRTFDIMIINTLTVLGPATDQSSEWRANLVEMRNQAAARGDRNMVALLDAVIGLLDADGNAAGLGEGLTGAYAKTWRKIVERLSS